MATTQTSKEYVGTGDGVNGTDLTWTYTFQSYQKEDIKVKVTDANANFVDVTNFTIDDWTAAGGTITFNNTGVNSNVCESTGAPKSNRTIRIYRETDITSGVVGVHDPKATYTAGSSIKADDLNNNQKQVLYAIHELRDQERITVNVRNSAITGTKIKDDEIDSQHYAAGSIDLEHMSANSVDSDQYVDGSVDLVHLSANSVDSSKIVDGSIVNADVNASAAIAQSKLNIANATTSAAGYQSAADKTKLDGIEASADVTDATNVNAAGAVMNSDLDVKGEILVGDGSGDPTALSVGTNDYVLTADSSTATGVAWKAASDAAAITIQDEGGSLSTAAEIINFVGAGVTASGTGTTKTITISGSGGSPITTDYQYLELKAHNNASGAFSAGAADYELVTKGTTTAVSPDQAAAMLISIAGVLQEPNTGTSIGSNDGFCIDGSSIHFGANLAAHPDYIIWMKGSGSHVVSDNSVNESKLNVSNAPTNSHVLTADSTVTGGLKWAAASGGVSDIVDDTSPQLGGNLDVQAREINTSTTNGNIKLTPNGTGLLEVKGNTNPGTIQLNCENNSHGVKIKGPAHSAAASYTLTLPDDDGSANQVLKTDGSGNLAWVAQTTNTDTQLTEEQVEDYVGGMVTGNTETGITVTYDDSDGTLDFVVGTLNQDTTGTADHVTITDNENTNENNLIAFVEDAGGAGSRGLETDGDFHYNPSTGTVTATAFAGSGASLTNLPASISDIVEHKATMTANHTIGTGNNGLVAGPFSTGSYTLTIPSGSVFTVV